MIKKIIKLALITFLLYGVILPVSALSADQLLPRSGEQSKSGDDFTIKLDNIEKYPETGNIANLPQLTDTSLFMNIIQIILGWSMLITLVALVVAAIYYLISRGKEEDITKAKDIIIYLLIGMAIMASAYGIVVGITQFRFFD